MKFRIIGTILLLIILGIVGWIVSDDDTPTQPAGDNQGLYIR